MQKQRLALITLLAASVVLGCAKDSGNDEKAGTKVEQAAADNRAKPAAGKTAEGTGSTTSPDNSTASAGDAARLRISTSSLVTEDVFGAVVVYPRRLLADPLFAEAKLDELIDDAIPDVQLSVTDLEQVVWLLGKPEKLQRTLVATHVGPAEATETTAAPEPDAPTAKPPINLDDLFEGLEAAKPVPPDEDQGFGFENDFEPDIPPAEPPADDMNFHAFDLYWTPKFMPMMLRFAESSKASQFSRLLTKEMSEAELQGVRYFKQDVASAKPPMFGFESSPAIRQYFSLGPMCVYLPDAHTVVLAAEPRIERMLTADDKSEATAATELKEVLDSDSAVAGAAAVIDFGRLRQSEGHQSLLEEISVQCLGSRMALLNLADDATVATVNIDVSAEALIQVELKSPTEAAARQRLDRTVENVVDLVSEVESPPQSPVGLIVDHLIQGISLDESATSITLQTGRPARFEQIPPVLTGLLEQVVAEAEEALWRHSLQQIARAIQDYAAEHERLPPAALRDASGTPLLSWRVLLLPYLGHEELFEQFHLDEPWNSAHNITLLDRMPAVYGKTGADTQVFVFTGPGTLFDADRETAESVLTSEDAASTILLVRTESTKPVAWTEPTDLDFSTSAAHQVLDEVGSKFLAAFCDGSVRYVEPAHEAKRLDEMISPE